MATKALIPHFALYHRYNQINKTMCHMYESKEHIEHKSNFHQKQPDQKLTLVWDLDETLICSVSAARSGIQAFEQCVQKAEIEEKTMHYSKRSFHYLKNAKLDMNHVIVFRPHMISALQKLQENFNFIVWTAAGSVYAEEVVKLIFNEHHKLRKPLALLNWSHCFPLPGQEILKISPENSLNYAKPLQIILQEFPQLQLQLEHLILIDNRKENGIYNSLQHFIHCDDFHDYTISDDDFFKTVIFNKLDLITTPEFHQVRLKYSFAQSRCVFPTFAQQYNKAIKLVLEQQQFQSLEKSKTNFLTQDDHNRNVIPDADMMDFNN